MTQPSSAAAPRLTHRTVDRDDGRGDRVILRYELPGAVQVGISYALAGGHVPFPHSESTTLLPRHFDATIIAPSIPYRATLTILVDGRRPPRCVSLELGMRQVVNEGEAVYDGPHAITSEGLRKVPVKSLMDLAIRAATHTVDDEHDGEGLSPNEVRALFAAPDALASQIAAGDTPRTTQGVQIDDDHYRRVAEVYQQAVAVGAPPRPEIAKWGTCSESTASKWIRGARDRGFLPPTTQGRASA